MKKTFKAKGSRTSYLTSNLSMLLRLFALLVVSFSSLAENNSEASAVTRAKINYQLPHIESSIQLDGIIDEAVWENALKISLNYETSPGENTQPSVETDVYLFEDGETLYIAFDARDNNPEQIRDFLLDRDNIWNSDFVGIKFDTFGESRKAFQFFTNARGIQADAIQEDFRGDDQTWDAIWDSHARINDNGYQVEMAIPFQAIRFPVSQSGQRWAFEVLRFLPRKNFHRIANSPVDRNIACSICQFDNLVGLKKVKPSKNIRLIPTLTFAKSESREVDSLGQVGPWQGQGIENRAGMDFRWGITEDTYLNATINPDFSQVEADRAQLDINRTFSIFVDEKRPFFLDGSDYFNSLNRLVHTRDVIEPDYGLKVTGQSGSHSYGAIVVNDAHTSFLLPASQGSILVLLENVESQNQILRYSYDFGGQNTLGLLATHKTSDGYSNQMTSIDGKYWFNERHSLSYQWMTSSNEYSPQMQADYAVTNDVTADHSEPGIGDASISGNAYQIDYEYETREWEAKVIVQEFDKDFRADLGFIGRVGFAKREVGVKRIWYPAEENSWWNKIQLSGRKEYSEDSDGTKIEESNKAKLKFEGFYQSNYGVALVLRNRLWDQIYFDEKVYVAFGDFEPIAGLRLGARYRWGDSIDFVNSQLGQVKNFSPSISWQVNQNILTSLNYTMQSFDVAQGELFNATIANFRLSYLFDERSSLRWTLQRIDIRKDPSLYDSFFNADPSDDEESLYKTLATQLLYTYRVNPQTLVFAGYSDSGFQDTRLAKIRNTDRGLFVKFSYAWQL